MPWCARIASAMGHDTCTSKPGWREMDKYEQLSVVSKNRTKLVSNELGKYP